MASKLSNIFDCVVPSNKNLGSQKAVLNILSISPHKKLSDLVILVLIWLSRSVISFKIFWGCSIIFSFIQASSFWKLRAYALNKSSSPCCDERNLSKLCCALCACSHKLNSQDSNFNLLRINRSILSTACCKYSWNLLYLCHKYDPRLSFDRLASSRSFTTLFLRRCWIDNKENF